jgi:hypothetical protein
MFEGFVNGIQYARKEALKEGYERARQEFGVKTLEIARKLKSMGRPDTEITEAIGLSSEDLAKL